MRLVIALLIIIFPVKAFAADALSTFYQQQNTLLQTPDSLQSVLPLSDTMDLYYQACTGANSISDLKGYNQWQCACTASKISELLDKPSQENLFENTAEGNFQRGRIMLLAYIPCLKTTIENFILDTCGKDAVCSCSARQTGAYIQKSGGNIIPGFMRDVYRSSAAPADPLAYLLTNPYFIDTSTNIMDRCAAS